MSLPETITLDVGEQYRAERRIDGKPTMVMTTAKEAMTVRVTGRVGENLACQNPLDGSAMLVAPKPPRPTGMDALFAAATAPEEPERQPRTVEELLDYMVKVG